jgi:hypothetical protein
VNCRRRYEVVIGGDVRRVTRGAALTAAHKLDLVRDFVLATARVCHRSQPPAWTIKPWRLKGLRARAEGYEVEAIIVSRER